MSKRLTTVQFFPEDISKIEELIKFIAEEQGIKAGKRVAVMYAVNKMLKEPKEN